MKVLFVFATPEYFRYYDTTVQTLAERGHEIVLAINRQRDAKPVRLDQLGWEHANVRAAGEIPRRGDSWEPIARALRGITDFSRYLDARYSAAPALRRRMKRKSLPHAFQWLDAFGSLRAPILRTWLRLLAACESAIPPGAAVTAFVSAQAPDLVLVSPLVDFMGEQVDTVKSARALGVPVAACIASWDNLTNKGLMRVVPDRVLVWNDAQRREASELHGVPAERVAITGAQLFDRWFERRPSTTREQFCDAHGLDPRRPLVLYTCSSSFIAPAAGELAFVRAWLGRLRREASLRDVNVLVRPHPYNVWDWEAADLSSFGPVAIFPRASYNPLAEETRAGFYDALHHSAAVVGINTSAMIEAAIVGRPVLSIRAEAFAATQEGTLHFHYLLRENGGFLEIADSLDAHASQLGAALADPERRRADAAGFVQRFIRPLGIARPCTPILADAIEEASRVSPAATPGVRYALLRPVLLLVAALAWPFEELASDKPFGSLRKEVRMRWHRARKDASGGLRRLRKRWT